MAETAAQIKPAASKRPAPNTKPKKGLAKKPTTSQGYSKVIGPAPSVPYESAPTAYQSTISPSTASQANSPAIAPKAGNSSIPKVRERKAETLKFQDPGKIPEFDNKGESHKLFSNLLDASPSQIASNFGSLGQLVQGKLNSESQQANKQTVLTASLSGAKKASSPHLATHTFTKGSIDLGLKEPEPKKGVEHYKIPRSQYSARGGNQDEGSKDRGWLSRVKAYFQSFLNTIIAVPRSILTHFGKAPRMLRTGRANPIRTANIVSNGRFLLRQQELATRQQLTGDLGDDALQQEAWTEKVTANTKAVKTKLPATKVSTEMTEYASMALPVNIRSKVDQQLKQKSAGRIGKLKKNSAQKAKAGADSVIRSIRNTVKAAKSLVSSSNKKVAYKRLSELNNLANDRAMGYQIIKDINTNYKNTSSAKKKKIDAKVKSEFAQNSRKVSGAIRKAESKAVSLKKQGHEKVLEVRKEAVKKNKNASWWRKVIGTLKKAYAWVKGKITNIYARVIKSIRHTFYSLKTKLISWISASRKKIVRWLNGLGFNLDHFLHSCRKSFGHVFGNVKSYFLTRLGNFKKVFNRFKKSLKASIGKMASRLGKLVKKGIRKTAIALKGGIKVAGHLFRGNFKKAAKTAFYTTCKVAGINPKPIVSFIKKTGNVAGKIFKQPVRFFKTLSRGVRGGLSKFQKKIKDHLLKGLFDWISGAMSDIQIEIPKKWDLKGKLSMITQLLGLTKESILTKLKGKLGPQGHEMVEFMENKLPMVKTLVTEGPAGLYHKAKAQFDSQREAAIQQIKTTIITSLVFQGIKSLALYLNPYGAFAKTVLMFYDFVMFLKDKKDQVKGFVTTLFSTIKPLAEGNHELAATKINKSLIASIPLALSLFASLLRLNGIGRSLRKVLQRFRKPIEKVIDNILAKLVKAIKRVVTGAKSTFKKFAAKLKKWWLRKKKFKDKNGTSHSLYFKKKRLMVASDPAPLQDYISERIPGIPKPDRDKLSALANDLEKAKKSTAKNAHRVIAKLQDQIAEVLDNYDLDALNTFHKPKGDTKTDPILINWYKMPSDYSKITYTSNGVTHNYSVTSPRKTLSSNTPSANPWEFNTKNLNMVGKKVKRRKNKKKRSKKYNGWAKTLRDARKAGTATYAVTHGMGTSRKLALGKVKDGTWDLDHVRPLRLGGKDDIDNLWPIKSSLNTKANNILEQHIYYEGKITQLKELGRTVWVKASKQISISADHNTSLTQPYTGNRSETNDLNLSLTAANNKTNATERNNALADIRKGTRNDPVTIIWNKKYSDYPTVKGKTILGTVPINANHTLKINREYLNPKDPWKLTRKKDRTTAATVSAELRKIASRQLSYEGKTLADNRPLDAYVQFDHTVDIAFLGPDNWSNVWIMRADKNSKAAEVYNQFVISHDHPDPIRAGHKDLKGKYMEIVKQVPAGPHGTSPQNPAGKQKLKEVKKRTASTT